MRRPRHARSGRCSRPRWGRLSARRAPTCAHRRAAHARRRALAPRAARPRRGDLGQSQPVRGQRRQALRRAAARSLEHLEAQVEEELRHLRSRCRSRRPLGAAVGGERAPHRPTTTSSTRRLAEGRMLHGLRAVVDWGNGAAPAPPACGAGRRGRRAARLARRHQHQRRLRSTDTSQLRDAVRVGAAAGPALDGDADRVRPSTSAATT